MSTPLHPLHLQIAASHRTELLLVACRYGLQNDGVPSSPSARWHAQRQADFLAWLAQGGFAQADATIDATKENSGIAPLSSTPAGAV